MLRQREGSVVCPECGRLVEVDADSCPNCGRWRPGLFGYAGLLTRIFGTVDVSSAILWSCVILYAAALALDPGAAIDGSRGGIFGLFSPGGRALYQLGMTGGAALQMGAWYTVFSAIYLHGSLLHILFNMLWLRQLGPVMEDMLGPARFFTLFVLAGAGGFLISNLQSGSPTVGASGSIFGLLAAGIVLGRHHGGSWGEAIQQQSMVWAGLLFVWGLLGSTTNNWAHGGGFVVGWLLTQALLRRSHRAESALDQLVALVLAICSLGAVLISFVRVSAYLI